METKLNRKEKVADGTMAFYLQKPAGYSYVPGQHAQFSFPKAGFWGKPLQRTFSFITIPSENEIGFATRMRKESDFKNKLNDYPLGGSLEVSPAEGSMVLPETANAPLVFLSGGIGITPFHSMIKGATIAKSDQSIILFYSNRNHESAAFLDELRQYQDQNAHFQLVATMTDPEIANWSGEKGYIDGKMITRYNQQWEHSIYYLAGPFAMVKAMKEVLSDLKIPSRQMVMETFTGY